MYRRKCRIDVRRPVDGIDGNCERGAGIDRSAHSSSSEPSVATGAAFISSMMRSLARTSTSLLRIDAALLPVSRPSFPQARPG